MKIYLVRHGQSEGNVDMSVHHDIADHAISLSADGMLQAEEAGRFLITQFNNAWEGQINARLWYSPYQRTTQTKNGILKALEANRIPMYFKHGVLEHQLLCEQQFGLFDGLTDEELESQYPNEFKHYKKCEDWAGKFWARMPLGESRFDVAQRVHQAFGTIHRDHDKHGINKLVIVSHGVTIRAFVMMWLHKSVDWFEKEPNPKNCSIRLIDDGEDRGYIFEGEAGIQI